MFKGIQFKKSKYPIFKVAFWILLICSLIMIFCIIKKNFCVFNIKNMGSTVKPITLNVAFNTKINEPIYVCFNDYCKPIENNSLIDNALNIINSYSASFDNSDEEFIAKKVKKIYLAYPAKLKNFAYMIDNIDLYIGDDYKRYEIEDIQKLNSKNVSILIDGQKEKTQYTLLEFENSNNNYGFLHCTGVILLSFILNWKFYIVPFSWLFVAILIYLFNKDVFKYSLKSKSVIFGVIVLIYLFFFGVSYFALPKLNNGENDLIDFALKDSKKYSDYEIHIISNKEKPLNLKDENITWHYIDIKKNETLKKIEREKYVPKNKRGVVYFDSNVVNIEMMSMGNRRLQIFRTNYNQNAKMVFYKEQ